MSRGRKSGKAASTGLQQAPAGTADAASTTTGWGNSDASSGIAGGTSAPEDDSWLVHDEATGSQGGPSPDGIADDVNSDFLSATNPDADSAAARVHAPEVLKRLDGALAGLGDAICTLLDLRIRGWEFAEADVAPQPVPNAVRDAIPVLVGMAVGSATAAIGGVVAASASGAIASAMAKEFVKSAVKDTVDDALNKSLSPAVEGALGKLGGAAEIDVVPAFFRAPGDALLRSRDLVRGDLRNEGRRKQLLGSEDPVGDILALTEKVRSQQDAARDIQQAHSVAAWTQLLARSACGTISEPDAAAHAERMSGPAAASGVSGAEAGTDLRQVHDGGPLSEPTPGVVRLKVVGTADGSVEILSASMAGTSPAAVERLRVDAVPADGGGGGPGRPQGTSELSVSELGLLVQVDGTFSVPEAHGPRPGPPQVGRLSGRTKLACSSWTPTMPRRSSGSRAIQHSRPTWTRQSTWLRHAKALVGSSKTVSGVRHPVASA